MTASQFGANHPDLIAGLAARQRLPVVYPFRYFVASGGLVSYGPDFVGQFRQAAGYIDRILKGEKPADLPVQAPTKYELVINLKTAKSLGIEVSPTLLPLRAAAMCRPGRDEEMSPVEQRDGRLKNVA